MVETFFFNLKENRANMHISKSSVHSKLVEKLILVDSHFFLFDFQDGMLRFIACFCGGWMLHKVCCFFKELEST